MVAGRGEEACWGERPGARSSDGLGRDTSILGGLRAVLGGGLLLEGREACFSLVFARSWKRVAMFSQTVVSNFTWRLLVLVRRVLIGETQRYASFWSRGVTWIRDQRGEETV